MTRYFVLRDGRVEANTATREDAINLIRTYQAEERHPVLRATFTIIEGKEEYVPYNWPPVPTSAKRIKDKSLSHRHLHLVTLR